MSMKSELIITQRGIQPLMGCLQGLRWELCFSGICIVPAVDDHGSGILKLSLFSVDLKKEAQDASRLLGDAVIGPADVLVVPDGTAVFRLRDRNRLNPADRLQEKGREWM